MSKHIGIVLHGGASESWIGDTESYHNTNTFLKSLVSRAEVLLRERAFAIDVATQVVAELEDYPAFNAGKGAAVNIDGNFEVCSRCSLLHSYYVSLINEHMYLYLAGSRHCEWCNLGILRCCMPPSHKKPN